MVNESTDHVMRVLVVDNDEPVLEVFADMIASFGVATRHSTASPMDFTNSPSSPTHRQGRNTLVRLHTAKYARRYQIAGAQRTAARSFRKMLALNASAPSPPPAVDLRCL